MVLRDPAADMSLTVTAPRNLVDNAPVPSSPKACRWWYCGYRFDHSSQTSGPSLVDLLRRPKNTTASLPELLSRWGTELAPEETVGYFGHCRLEERAGYLLITTDRVAFFAGRGRNGCIDWPRAAVSATLKRRTLRGAQLRFEVPEAQRRPSTALPRARRPTRCSPPSRRQLEQGDLRAAARRTARRSKSKLSRATS